MFQFTVPGMTCGGCARRVTNAILSVDPQAQIVTDPPSRDVKVTTKANEQVLLTALSSAGYPAERKHRPTAA